MVLLASSAQRSGILLNTRQYTQKPPTTKRSAIPNVSSATVEERVLETSSVGITEHANKISKDGDKMTGGRELLGVEAGRWARGNSFF